MLDSMESVRTLFRANRGETLPGGDLHVAYLVAVKMIDIDLKKQEYRVTEQGKDEIRFWEGYLGC